MTDVKPKKVVGKKGEPKTGGRQKGTPNKQTRYQQALAKVVAASKTAKKAGDGRKGNGVPGRKPEGIDPETGVEYDKYGNALGPDYGTDPVEFLLALAADRRQPTAFRAAAAKDVAKFVRPTLQSVTLKGDPNKPLVNRDLTSEEFADIAKQVAKDI